MVGAAEAIGAAFTYGRIDLYRTPGGRLYLGEITLCPFNTPAEFSDPGFDAWLGEHWDHAAMPELVATG